MNVMVKRFEYFMRIVLQVGVLAAIVWVATTPFNSAALAAGKTALMSPDGATPTAQSDSSLVTEAPKSLKPHDGAKLKTPTPVFKWTPVENVVFYHVAIADSPNFLNGDWSARYDFYVEATQTSGSPEYLNPGVYYWAVSGVDENWIDGPFSEVRSFTISPLQPHPWGCPTVSANTYAPVGVDQYDLDDPVRPAAENADKNLSVRGWYLADDQQPRDFMDYGPPSDKKMPPQIATLFAPYRVPEFAQNAKILDWSWNPSPDPGMPSGIYDNVAVSLLALGVPQGEALHSPKHGYDLGKPLGIGGAVVLYADEYSITLKFTREDSVATGYTMHITDICVDPNLLALYRSLDNEDRNSFGPGSGNTPRDGIPDYDLPGLKQGQFFGSAQWYYVYVAIRDTGMFLDPRSITEWWQIHPGK